MEYIFDRNKIDDLIETLEEEDIVRITGKDFIALLGNKSVSSRGRKPIEVDLSLFDETVMLWQNGEITARQAMERLNLKPNTFYRRIKERGKSDMNNLRTEMKETIEDNVKQLEELKKHVREDAKSIKSKADEKIEQAVSLGQMELDIRHEKIAAEIEHLHAERALRETVEKEREAHKEQAKS